MFNINNTAMGHLIVILFLMGIFSIFTSKSIKLTKEETALVKKLNFDIDLITKLKRETESDIIQLPKINEYGEVLEELYDGLQSKLSEQNARAVVANLKNKFKNKGYLIFIFGDGQNYSVGVIKGNEELDILKYRRTDGINYNLENEDIVKKIAEWKDNYGITIIGCGLDWLEIEFDKLPSDLDTFANEIYEFCPDIVDEPGRKVEDLKALIEKEHGVWLWWD